MSLASFFNIALHSDFFTNFPAFASCFHFSFVVLYFLCTFPCAYMHMVQFASYFFSNTKTKYTKAFSVFLKPVFNSAAYTNVNITLLKLK